MMMECPMCHEMMEIKVMKPMGKDMEPKGEKMEMKDKDDGLMKAMMKKKMSKRY